MPRISLDLEAPVYSRLERRSRIAGRPLEQTAVELLEIGLAAAPGAGTLEWISAPMQPRVDLEDKDALLDRE